MSAGDWAVILPMFLLLLLLFALVVWEAGRGGF
jgi:hypothetical protein